MQRYRNKLAYARKVFFFVWQVYPVHFSLPLIKVLPQYLATAVLRFFSQGHHLRIEIGRWDKIPKQDRKSLHCDVVDDEIHVITDCLCYQDETKVLLQKLKLSFNFGPQKIVSSNWHTYTNGDLQHENRRVGLHFAKSATQIVVDSKN